MNFARDAEITEEKKYLLSLRDSKEFREAECLLNSPVKYEVPEQAVDPSFISFCYPNGNYNNKIVRMARNAGYNLAVTAKKGWKHGEGDPFTLKRIGIYQDMTSTDAMFGCRVAGIF